MKQEHESTCTSVLRQHTLEMRKPDRVAINLHSYLVQKRSLLLWRCATQHIIPLYLFQSPHKRKQIFLISCHCWRTTKRQGQYLPCLRPIKGISWFQFEGWNPTGFVQLQKWLNIIWKDYNKEQIIKEPSGRLKTKTKKKGDKGIEKAITNLAKDEDQVLWLSFMTPEKGKSYI